MRTVCPCRPRPALGWDLSRARPADSDRFPGAHSPPAPGSETTAVPFYAPRSISDATSPPSRMTSEVTYIHSSSTITVPSSP